MNRVLLSTRKGLVEMSSRDGGLHYDKTHFLGDPVSVTASDASGRWWAALNLGHFGTKLHRSEDRGETWQEIAVPAYPEKPEDPDDPNTWVLQQIWCLEVDPKVPGRLWAGTIPGGLFRSDDYGDSWELNEALWSVPERKGWFGGGYDQPGIHSVAIHPQDSNHLTVGVSCGGVWKSHDGGDSWTLVGEGLRAAFMPEDMQFNKAIQDVHRLVVSPTDPNRVWVQHHNGVFVSSDGAETFTELEPAPSAFGFAVAVHPTEPDRAWFVPGKKDEFRYPVDLAMLVNRTDDAGKSFTAQREGLPQEACFDLVYRHGLAVDDTGHRLVMGSTTGNAWFSDNGGAQWQTVSTHLPPVYAVAFAE